MLDLRECAKAILAQSKGILAADESTKTADARLTHYGIASSEKSRIAYRELFLDAPDNETYLSGVILYEETLHQKTSQGVSFPKLLRDRGIIVGIKVDQGTEPFPGSPSELITNGLLGLAERLSEYKKKYGVSFTKWRSVVTIDGEQLPSALALHENAKRLASYALVAQQAALVPIVEPEVIYAGNHSRLRAKDVLRDTLSVLVSCLEDQAVDMSAVILKTSMVLSGSESGKKDTPEEVAKDTLDVLIETIPASMPGIVFLSGGQETEQATDNLRAIIHEAKTRNAPWPLTFSFARALQDEALTTWAGKDENIPEAQKVFIQRLQKTQAALLQI